MRRSLLTIIGIAIMCVALVRPHHALAAVNEDFESYAPGTLAEALTNPNVTFDGSGTWAVVPGPGTSPTCMLDGMILIGGSVALAMDFSTPQGSYQMGYYTNTATLFIVEGYLNGSLVFTDSFVTGFCAPLSASDYGGVATGSGIVFDRLVVNDNTGNGQLIDNLVTTDAPVAATALNVPHVSDIRIDTHSPVTPYDSPAGSPVRLSNGSTFDLPHDYDSNGFDTYVVTDTAVVDGVTWYSIFLGNQSFVWVKGSEVILQ